jgi:hypothetical protein
VWHGQGRAMNRIGSPCPAKRDTCSPSTREAALAITEQPEQFLRAFGAKATHYFRSHVARVHSLRTALQGYIGFGGPSFDIAACQQRYPCLDVIENHMKVPWVVRPLFLQR